MLHLGYVRLRSLLLVFSIPVLVALTACGGSSDPTNTPSSGSNPTATSSSGSNPTATATSDTDTGDFTDATCDSITAAASIPGVLAGVHASGSPTSQFAQGLSSFFADVLDNALDGAEPSCFYEITNGGDTAVWIAYHVDHAIPADVTSLISDELVAQGADRDNIASFSGGAGEGVSTTLIVTGLPVLGAYEDSGAFLYVTGDAIVLVAGSGAGSDGGDETPTAVPTSSSDGGEATATPAPVVEEEPSSDLISAIDGVLRPALQDALDTSLVLGINFSGTQDGVTTVFITYAATPELTGDYQSEFRQIIEQLGGTVDSSIAIGGSTSANFTGATISGQTFSGSIITSDGGLTLSIQTQ